MSICVLCPDYFPVTRSLTCAGKMCTHGAGSPEHLRLCTLLTDLGSGVSDFWEQTSFFMNLSGLKLWKENKPFLSGSLRHSDV